MKTVIAEHSGELILISNDWSNSHDESIINYLLVAQIKAIFLKSIATEKNHHTEKYITDELIEVISEIDAQNIVAVTTDNVSNMKSSWLQLSYDKSSCWGYYEAADASWSLWDSKENQSILKKLRCFDWIA